MLLGSTLGMVAQIGSFIISNILNYILNQLITYPEHRPTTLTEWVVRCLKNQIMSVTSLGVAIVIALLLTYFLNVSPYLANILGLACSFAYKFFVSDRFIYRGKESSVATVEK